jgi:hypothetical protein
MTGCGGGGGGSAPSTENAAGTSEASSPATASAVDASGATATPTSPQAGGTGYPFGSRRDKYVAGILPSESTAKMDAALAAHYDAWKAHAIIPADSVAPGGLAVKFSNSSYMAVSEGMGYGMLLAVVFAGHDPQAQNLFDGLLAVVRARPAFGFKSFGSEGEYLMEWRLNSDGSSAGEGWNAMDGDLDIAMALLMAHRQWGSSGKWNYLQEGKNTISAMKRWNMKEDGATRGLPNANNNRTSDYMIGHFRAFKAATGDKLWDRAVDKAHKLLDRMQKVYSPNAGLVPDFVINTDSESPAPSTGYIGDGNDKEGNFWWNACRNPWRFASDYVLSGDERFATVTGRMIDFFKNKSGGDPANIGTGYALDGTMLTGGNMPGGNSAAYIGPICAGACVHPRFQGFLDATWSWNMGRLTTGYYDGEIQLLSLVVASGNWWSTVRT